MTKAIQNVELGVPSMLQVIADAARDPAVDPIKLRELLALHRDLESDRDRRDFMDHMSQLQGEITQIATDAANKSTSSRYASYAALDRALRPYYVRHGFSVSFDSERTAPDTTRVVCIVSRGSWETRHHAEVVSDGKGAKGGDVMTKTHAGASGLQYGKRYALAMAFNLVVARDDDGNAASERMISTAVIDELVTMCNDAGVDPREVCEFFTIPTFAAIPQQYVNKVKTFIKSKAIKREATHA